MYLSKLDIVGFKSFAQKTNLRFTGGVSAIVGPNGCGKSNIVDAIRWVLGEQKTTALRSDVMENVIFNGTKNRKPVGMAEVSLTIENNKNILPSEYNEVVVTRRLFRSGESEYLLNNTKCRLKNIIDLFMDTGLGSDSYSVIELKMVEAILSGRGEDRRNLFEEAAGIKKYKLQRKEATKKLNDVINDLTRVNDLMEEVRKNVNTLYRHAQKTRRYNTLNEEFRTVDTKLSYYQYHNFNQVSTLLKNEIDAISIDKIRIETELSEKNIYIAKLKTEHKETELEYNSYIEQETKISKAVSQSEQEIAVSNEKIIRVASDEERLNNEIENTNRKLTITIEQTSKTNENIEKLNSELEKVNEDLNITKSKVEIAKNNTVTARNNVNAITQKLQSINSNISTNISNVSRDTDKKNTLQNKILQFNQDKDELQIEINNIDKKLSDRTAQTSKYTEQLAEKENYLVLQKEKQEQLQIKLETQKEELLKLRADKNQKNASFDFLHNLVDTSETSKFLYSNKWSDNDDILMLSESIAASDNMKNALSVTFSNYSDYYISKNETEANNAISLLKQNNKGKAGFINLDKIPDVSAPSNVNGDGVIGWFSEVIRVDNKLRNAVRLLFDGLLVVENIKNDGTSITGCNPLFINNSDVKSIVSLDGEYIHKAGARFGGSIKEGEGARFGKLEKMNNLKNEINEIEALINTSDEKKQILEKQLSIIDLQSIINEIRAIENEQKTFENKTQQLKLDKKQLQNNFELLENNIETYKNDITELENEINDILSKNETNKQELSDMEQQLLVSKNNLATLEAKQNEIDNEVRQVELAQVRLIGEINSANNDKIRLTQQEQNYRNSIESRKLELLNNSKLSNELKKKIEELTLSVSEDRKQLVELEIKIDFVAEKKKTLKEQLDDVENEIGNIRKQHDRIIENIHQKELKLSETNTWLRNIINNFYNNYQQDISMIEVELPSDFAEDDTKKLIEELKQKLQNLGSINFAAIEEYDVEKERLDFLEKQIADLIEAEKILRESIDEINKTAERIFLATFSQIQLNFQSLFKKLFDEEGESDIKFDESNPLESDISIIARPPNKRPTSIEQLSGGEKTLTAISLLFAIYLVKPSPFCILDEVDAPLDDNNVMRFLNIIREFSKDTQFLIVTHNKTTMSAADILYGVTMQEPGVSKTASVKLEEVE
jgi:chromosome segregation protein